MKNRRRQFGFSLVEVLMAVGVLTVGLLMVAGTFPVGIHLVAISTERTLGAVASDEAFAKIRLYGVDETKLNNSPPCKDFYDVSKYTINDDEFLYPSDPSNDNRVYSWSAICRKNSSITNDTSAQITVFVSRRVSNALQYYGQDASYAPSGTSNWPLPNLIGSVTGNQGENNINVGAANIGYFSDDSVIVDNANGKIYRVIELDQAAGVIYLDRKLEDAVSGVWVVPVPIGGGKNPCVGVYQRIID